MRSMSREKVAGALQRPKGTWLNSNQVTAAGAEGCLLLVPFLNRGLTEPTLEIEGGEPAGPV